MHRFITFFNTAFPFWVLICSLLALIKPEIFTWFTGSLITYGLGVIMLGMGLTLRPEDFRQVAKTPKWVLIGAVLQFTVMPFFGWVIGILLNLPTPFAVGLIIVSCCPGGTASNVIAFLARANVALSVSMTAVSTLLAIIMTPLLTSWLIGDRVPVDAWQLFWGTTKVVLLPVLLGVSLNWFLPKFTQKIIPYSPPVAVISIVLIVASIIGQGKEEILESGLLLISAVSLLHVAGFSLGYLITKILVKDEGASRTVCIEVGMQNSGLGAYLARANFVNPATAIPSALSSATHCILGSIVAAIFRKTQPKVIESVNEISNKQDNHKTTILID